MRILIHTLDTNEHFKYLRNLINESCSYEHELIFIVQNKDTKIQSSSWLMNITNRLKLEINLIKMSKRNHELLLYFKNRIRMIFYKKQKNEYDNKKWQTIHDYFNEKNKKYKDVLPVIKINNINHEGKLIKKIDPDLFIVVGAPFIRRNIINLLSEKIKINLHIGYLPHYRGILCPEVAFLKNDINRIGYTIHELSPELDKGKVYIRENFQVTGKIINMGELYNKMYINSFNNIVKFINADNIETKNVNYSFGKLYNSYSFNPRNYKILNKMSYNEK